MKKFSDILLIIFVVSVPVWVEFLIKALDNIKNFL